MWAAFINQIEWPYGVVLAGGVAGAAVSGAGAADGGVEPSAGVVAGAVAAVVSAAGTGKGALSVKICKSMLFSFASVSIEAPPETSIVTVTGIEPPSRKSFGDPT